MWGNHILAELDGEAGYCKEHQNYWAVTAAILTPPPPTKDIRVYPSTQGDWT